MSMKSVTVYTRDGQCHTLAKAETSDRIEIWEEPFDRFVTGDSLIKFIEMRGSEKVAVTAYRRGAIDRYVARNDTAK